MITWKRLARCGLLGAAAVPLEAAAMSESPEPFVRALALSILALVTVDEGRLGHSQEFARMARELLTGADIGDSPQSSLVFTALGAVHAAAGRSAQARAELEHALRSRRRWIGISPWPTVEALLRLAPVLLDVGDREGATALLDEAKDLLASLPDGAEAQLERLRRIRRRLSPRARDVLPEARLTEREEAVLRLLRGTPSIREIGHELHLSENTIKTHTRAIYRKLGVTGRREAIEQGRELGIL